MSITGHDITRYDFKKIRSDRQTHNHDTVLDSIKENNPKKFHANINKEALKRMLEYVSIDFEQFWNKCQTDDLFARTCSMNVSKNSSRQGAKDEPLQYNVGIPNLPKNMTIEQLNKANNITRIQKNGVIVTKKYVNKDTDDGKSFDACIKENGDIKGYITCKIIMSGGGHQGNAYTEMYTLADSWEKHKSQYDERLIIIIDTDEIEPFENFRKKYEMSSNIHIVNHISFQELIISLYH